MGVLISLGFGWVLWCFLSLNVNFDESIYSFFWVEGRWETIVEVRGIDLGLGFFEDDEGFFEYR